MKTVHSPWRWNISRWDALAFSIGERHARAAWIVPIRPPPNLCGRIADPAGTRCPTLTVLIASTAAMIWFFIQARLEEMNLVQRIPEYKDYIRQMPRFIPRLRR